MLGSLRVKQPRGQRLQKRQIALNLFRLIGQKKAHFFGVVKKVLVILDVEGISRTQS